MPRFSLAAFALLPGDAAQFTLHLLPAATYPRAKCLDGSQGGFYGAPGVGAGAANFLIHTQGGGWCTSDRDCAARSRSDLGSSKNWAATGCTGGDSDAAPPTAAGGSTRPAFIWRPFSLAPSSNSTDMPGHQLPNR